MEYPYIGKLICDIITSKDTKALKKTVKSLTRYDWANIYQFALSYNLIPLLYSKLHKNKLTAETPKTILSQLQKTFNYCNCILIKREAEIKKILLRFNKDKTDVVVLKGSYLAEKYYDNATERPMSDIDLLIRFSDLEKTVSILKKLGYSLAEEYHIDTRLKNAKHLPLFQGPGRTSIEVHWTIYHPVVCSKPGLDMDELWRNMRKAHLLGVECLALAPEDLLVYLCIHIAEDKFQQKILHLYDIVKVIEKSNISWDIVFEKANKWDAIKPVYCVLLCMNNFFNVNLSKKIIEKFRPVDDLSSLPDLLEKVIFAKLTPQETHADNIVQIFNNRTFWGNFKYLLWTYFSREKVAFHYGVDPHSWTIYYYHVKRVLYLLKKYVKTCIELYIKNPRKRNEKRIQHRDSLQPLEKWLGE